MIIDSYSVGREKLGAPNFDVDGWPKNRVGSSQLYQFHGGKA